MLFTLCSPIHTTRKRSLPHTLYLSYHTRLLSFPTPLHEPKSLITIPQKPKRQMVAKNSKEPTWATAQHGAARLDRCDGYSYGSERHARYTPDAFFKLLPFVSSRLIILLYFLVFILSLFTYFLRIRLSYSFTSISYFDRDVKGRSSIPARCLWSGVSGRIPTDTGARPWISFLEALTARLVSSRSWVTVYGCHTIVIVRRIGLMFIHPGNGTGVNWALFRLIFCISFPCWRWLVVSRQTTNRISALLIIPSPLFYLIISFIH